MMTSPIARDYYTFATALFNTFGVTTIEELPEHEREISLSDDRLLEWPTVDMYSYYDLEHDGNAIVRRNAMILRKRGGHQVSDPFCIFHPDSTNVYRWLLSYVKFANQCLHDLGYKVNPVVQDFQLPLSDPELLSESSGTEESIIVSENSQELSDLSDPQFEVILELERNVHDLNVTIIPSDASIDVMPIPQLHGIKINELITVSDLDADFMIKELSRARYLTKPIPRLPTIIAEPISGVWRTGADCNDLIQQIWMGNFSEAMATQAIDLCVRIMRGYLRVPDDSTVIIPYPRDANRYEWNSRTTALFYISGLFVIAFQLWKRNLLTPQVFHTAYEIITRYLDVEVKNSRISIACTHVYNTIVFNYSPSDIVNQFRLVDWIGNWWNYYVNTISDDGAHLISMWIKLVLIRAGDAKKIVRTDQTIVPKPFNRESFTKFRPGSLVSKSEFIHEVKRLQDRPASLQQNEVTEITYSYPGRGEWMTDRNDKFVVPENGKNIILFTALLIARSYSVQDVISLFRRVNDT